MSFFKVNVNAFSRRLNDLDSSYACLLLMSKYYDKDFNEEVFMQKVDFNNENNSLFEISRAAEKIGFRAKCVNLTFSQLMNDAPLPCILKWDQYHHAIVLPPKRWLINKQIQCVHPNKGVVTYTNEEFQQHWVCDAREDGKSAGSVLILEPSVGFYSDQKKEKNMFSWQVMLQYFRRGRLQVIQVISALLIASMFQLIIPFLMQSIVDIGINTQDLHYITILLIAQSMLIISRLSVDLIRDRLLLHISSTVNLAIVSDFWNKLARLPMAYFDRQHTGDILQRMNDNRHVQSFITGPLLNSMFSILNFFVFAVVLMMYKLQLFFIFLIGIVIYFAWMRFF
jgi:ATP-binding cassette, subfamily B, bacterial